MADQVLDELREVDEYSWKWQGRQTMDFGGKIWDVDLLVQGNQQNEITERQKEAFHCFMEKWAELQELLVTALLEYYNEEERFSYGPEDEEEAGEWWPEIETKEALLKAVTLESVIVAEDFMMDKGRCIYLLFSRIWGGEDLEDNGIGVCFINETIDEIAYKDIAF